MSIPCRLTRRTNQKARTRAAPLAATRALLAEGVAGNGRAGRRPRRHLAHHRLPRFVNRRCWRGLSGDRPARCWMSTRPPIRRAVGSVIERFHPATCASTRPPCAPSCACRSEPGPTDPAQLPFRKGRAIRLDRGRIGPTSRAYAGLRAATPRARDPCHNRDRGARLAHRRRRPTCRRNRRLMSSARCRRLRGRACRDRRRRGCPGPDEAVAST